MDFSLIINELTSVDLYLNILISLKNVFYGFIIALICALFLNIFLYECKKIGKVVYPIIEIFRPIPNAGWIPIAIILCNSIEGSIIFITFVGAFFPIFLNIHRALENISENYLNIAKLYKLNRFDRISKIVIPCISSDIFTSMMLGISGAWLSVIMAEMISGKTGLGYYTWKSYTLLNYEQVFLGILFMGILGAFFSLFFSILSKKVVFWKKKGG